MTETAATAAERRWYLLLTDPDGGVDGLIGPVKGDRADAEELMRSMLANDQRLADAVDWNADGDVVCAPYWYANVQAIDLGPTEVRHLVEQCK